MVIPTYPAPPPEPNPMFFEKRVNQGASGRVYPNPFTDRLSRRTGGPSVSGGHPGERVSPAHGPARARRAHLRAASTRPTAMTSSTASTSSSRRSSAPSAPGSRAASSSTGPAPPPLHLHARRLLHRGARGRQPHRLAERARADGSHQGHGGHLPAPRQGLHRDQGAALQPHAVSADLPVVGERGRPRPRRVPGLSSRPM